MIGGKMKFFKYGIWLTLIFCFSCVGMIKSGMYSMNFPSTFSPDNKYLACINGKNILIFHTGNWKLFRRLKYHKDIVHHIAFLPRGDLLVSSGWDSKLVFWNTRTWQVEQQYDGVGKGHITVSPDGAYLALEKYSGMLAGDDTFPARVFHLYPALSMKKIFSEARFQQIAFAPGSDYLVSLDDDGKLLKMSLPDFKVKRIFTLPDSKFFRMRFINSDEILVQYSRGTFSFSHEMIVFNVKTGRIRARFDMEKFDFSSRYLTFFMEVLENDNVLLSNSDRLIIYNLAERKILRKMITEDNIYMGSINNEYLVINTYSSSAKGRVLIYRMDNLTKIQELAIH